MRIESFYHKNLSSYWIPFFYLMIGTLFLHSRGISGTLLNPLGLRIWHIRVMMNVAIRVGRFVVHHNLGLGALYSICLGTILSHNRHSYRRLVGKMISVTSSRTARPVRRELMDARYRTRKVASKRREIHCRWSIEYLKHRTQRLLISKEKWKIIIKINQNKWIRCHSD